jgi:hypothetical protein
MKHTYTPPPLRESRPHKSAADIQRDIDLMRVMYAERRSMNRIRQETMIGWSLVAVAVGLPIIIAIAILI